AYFPSASILFVPVFYGPSIVGNPLGENINSNQTLLGATPTQLARWGYGSRAVPSVDGAIDQCRPLVGGTAVACWAELDEYLMEKVVPWIPLVYDQAVAVRSPRVLGYSVDQFTGLPALDRIALTR